MAKSSIGVTARTFIIIVSIVIPLTASMAFGSQFLASLGQGVSKWMLYLLSGAVIFSSVSLGYLNGKCRDAGRSGYAALCIVTWFMVAMFSTVTTTLSVLNASGSTINRQISGSTKNRTIEASVQANLQTIASLQATINQLDPVEWRTRRAQLAEQIKGTQQQNISLLRMQTAMRTKGEGSAVAQSFAELARYGITRLRVAILAALLLDMIPFVIASCLGALDGRRREVVAGKKSQAPLRRVK